MSITYTYDQIDESQGEITSNSVSYERKYRVFASETTEEINVINYINGQVARKVGSAFCDSISAEAQDGSQNKVWTVTVRWRRQQQNQDTNYPKEQPLIYDESFQSSGERKHVDFAQSETVYTRTGHVGSQFYNRIGQNGEGTDVETPVFNFSLSRRFNYNDVTSTVRNQWLNLYGCLNSDMFFEFGPGIVKFVGFSGRTTIEYDGSLKTIDGVIYQAAQVYYDITFNFQCKPILVNQLVGGIACSEVPGWATPWVESVKVDDQNTGRTVDMPIAVHVADTNRYAAFSTVF